MGLDRLLRTGLKSGDLAMQPLVEVVGYCYAARKTGELALTKGKVERRVYFSDGLPVFASSNALTDTVPEMMVKLGRLEARDLPRIKELMEKQALSEEQALVSLRVMESSQYGHFKAQFAREIIVSSCGWREGHFIFNDTDKLAEEVPHYDLNPMEIIYEAIMLYHEISLAEEIQTMEKRTISLNPEAKEFLLLPEDYYIYTDTLDGFSLETTVGEAIARLYDEFGDISKTLTFLYILLVTGTLVFTDVEPGAETETEQDIPGRAAPPEDEDDSTAYVVVKARKRKKTPAPPAEVEPEMEPEPEAASPEESEEISEEKEEAAAPLSEASEPEPEPEPAAPPETEEPGPEPSPVEETPHGMDFERKPEPVDETFIQRVGLLEKKFEDADNYYQVLGVDTGAGLQDLHKAYTRIASHYRVDRLVDDPKLQERLQTLRDRLNEAVQTLSNPEVRAGYEKQLYADELKKAWNIPLKRELARREFNRGKWYLDNNRPELAVSCFEHANSLVPEVPDYFAYVGWAKYRAKMGTMEEINGYLRHSLEANSRYDMAYYFMGVIAKREGDEEHAEDMFRKALELNPKNTRAARELSFIEKNKKRKGFLSQLFSK